MTHKIKNDSFLHKLFTSIFQIVTFIIIAAIGLALVMGFVIKVITGYDHYLLIVLVCSVFNIMMSGLLFIVISNSFKKKIGELSDAFQSESQGDINQQFEDAAKKNKILAKVSDQMKAARLQMRSVVEETYNLTKAILDSSFDVTEKVKEASASIHEINETIEEMAAGASTQALETEQSIEALEELSGQISIVSDGYQIIMNETSNVNQLNKAGLSTVYELKQKSDSYNETSEKIFQAVDNLTNTLKNIDTFVNTIKDIAEQTNLLALNAAIEAARAGEYGKGFAVVADEVRKLADQSKNSTEEIGNLMLTIRKDTYEAVAAMDSMKVVSREQLEAVTHTENSFDNIANAIESITAKIQETNDAIQQITESKNKTFKAVESSARISEEMAAGSEEFAAHFDAQLKMFNNLEKTAVKLRNLSEEMDEKLKKY